MDNPPFYLTQEELRALFDAVYERDMANLRRQQAELKAVLDATEAALYYRPPKPSRENPYLS